MAATPACPPSVEELTYPARSLVLLTGLPGAGKSTLLDRLYGLRGDETRPVTAGDAVVIDSRQSRAWWAPRLAPLPPRLRTPIVHTTHMARIVRAVLRGHAVVAHSRGTWPHIMYGLAWVARLGGAEMHLVMLDVEPGVARKGQLTRGRVVPAGLFTWHCRRWRRIVARARTGAVPPAVSATVLDRPAADRLQAIRFAKR
ncbi:ATP-binding protein [Planomonospora venezuelensis]|uniref:Energy-coupling factor transporter ATP-binding protein EcfA2 n=1 Tax=Planomonospora venezuelensis TaxID=1999 RepID=A0A841DBS7_PLAVE|nr:ATP-binding protein [Planomonospora venezuelensis]MBB5968102.1 energy-coupling factor transporter ATP-binding protein EcfA2 [Planomonospora venezuelensis]GIN04349.1 ATP-binding protein [Planomonospora venezuelensis]